MNEKINRLEQGASDSSKDRLDDIDKELRELFKQCDELKDFIGGFSRETTNDIERIERDIKNLN